MDWIFLQLHDYVIVFVLFKLHNNRKLLTKDRRLVQWYDREFKSSWNYWDFKWYTKPNRSQCRITMMWAKTQNRNKTSIEANCYLSYTHINWCIHTYIHIYIHTMFFHWAGFIQEIFKIFVDVLPQGYYHLQTVKLEKTKWGYERDQEVDKKSYHMALNWLCSTHNGLLPTFT